jgi:RHS repeat-associated protein
MVTGISGDNGTGTNSLTYDALRRLTAESGLASARSYQYDLDGNRTRKVEGATTIDYAYDRTDELINQTISGTGTAFSYDAYGDQTQAANSVSAVTTSTFDTASHLTAINAPGTTADVALSLDALGRFATQTVNGATDTYGYVGSSETVLAIVGATTRLSALSGDGSRVATQDGRWAAFLVPDLHGNVVAAEASGSTAIVNAIRYDGYGQTLGTPYTAAMAIGMDARYQGRLDLSATSDSLYDMAARFYAPGSGAFTQVDSVTGSAQDPLSMNRFLYAEANPTTFIDPTGHFVSEEDSTQATRCVHAGDSGCGSTRATSKSKIRWSHSRSSGRHWNWNEKPATSPRRTAARDEASRDVPLETPQKHDGFGWFAVGVGRGVVDVGIGAVTSVPFALTHLSEAATGFQCFTQDGCLARAGHTVGIDHAPENFRRGIDYVHSLPDEDKGHFAGAVATTAILARGLAKLPRGTGASEDTGVVFRSNASHIFREATGHLAEDTPANRALLQGAVQPSNLVGVRPEGSISVYRQLMADGRQVWVEVKDGTEITNGGVNELPRP